MDIAPKAAAPIYAMETLRSKIGTHSSGPIACPKNLCDKTIDTPPPLLFGDPIAASS
jgi:hypothetical protein